jgi:methyl-accepting chemotaxis protein
LTSFSKHTSAGTETVAATTQEQLAAMEEISASSQSLSKLAQERKDIVVQFTL